MILGRFRRSPRTFIIFGVLVLGTPLLGVPRFRALLTGSKGGLDVVPVASPSGGEVWAAGAVDSAWLAVGPGGTYASLDQGQAWRRVGPGPRNELGVRPDPLNIRRVGRYAFLNLEGRVLRSEDIGKTWNPAFEAASQVFEYAGHAYALTPGFLLRSRDGGLTWTDRVHATAPEARIPVSATADVVVVSPSAAYLSDGRSAWRSLDGGTSWEALEGVLARFPPPPPPVRGPPSPTPHAEHAALGRDLFALVSNGEVYRSSDFGSTWSALPGRITHPRAGASRLIAAGGELWLSGNRVTCRLRTAPVGCDTVPGLPETYGMISHGGLVAATPEGIWHREPGGGEWTSRSKGIPATVLGIARVGTTYVTAANRALFRSSDSLKTWRSGRRFASPVHSVVSATDQVLALTADSLVACDPELRECTARVIAVSDADSVIKIHRPHGGLRFSDGVVRTAARLLPSPGGAVLRSDNMGRTWRIEALTPDPAVQHVWAAGEHVYALTASGIAAGRGRGEKMRTIAALPAESRRTIVSVAGPTVLLGTDGGALIRLVLRRDSVVKRTTLRAEGLDGQLNALWQSPDNARAVVAATSAGLLWSSDGGDSFNSPTSKGDAAGGVAATQILQVGESDLLAATAAGVQRLRYRMPRPNAINRAKGLSKHPLVTSGWVVLPVLLGAIAVCFNAMRRGNMMHAQGPLGVLARHVLVKLPWIGIRLRLMFYRTHLSGQREVRAAGEYFFGLPAKGPDGTAFGIQDASALIAAVALQSRPRTPVVVLAGGGAGKTTLVGRIAWLYVKKRLPEPWKAYRPLIVRAQEYKAGLAQALANALNNDYAAGVDEKSVIQFMATERFLVLFDGTSEIETEDRERTYVDLLRSAASHDFANSRFVVFGRPIGHTPDEFPVFRLLPLNIHQIQSEILPSSGLSGSEQQRVLRELSKLGTSAITPLLLHMAMETPESTGDVSPSESGLFERYFRRLLRIEGESADFQWRGWKLLLAAFAGESLIQRGQRGAGLVHERATSVLREAAAGEVPLIENLRSDYRIKGVESSFDALESLAEAQILARDGAERWRFTHDPFEEYFAAVRLAQVVQEAGKWSDVDKWMTTTERTNEFGEVLRSAVELGVAPELLNAAPDRMPQLWRNILEGPLD